MLRTVNHFSLHRINSTELRVVSDVSEGVLPVIVAEENVVRKYSQAPDWPHHSITLFVLEDLQPLLKQFRTSPGSTVLGQKSLSVADIVSLSSRPVVNVYDLTDLSTCNVFVNRDEMVAQRYWGDSQAMLALFAHEHAHPLSENEATAASRAIHFQMLGIQGADQKAVGPSLSKVGSLLGQLAEKLSLLAPREILTNQRAIQGGFSDELLHLNTHNIQNAIASMVGRVGLSKHLQQQVEKGELTRDEIELLLLVGDLNVFLPLAMEIAPFFRAGQPDAGQILENLLTQVVFQALDPVAVRCFIELQKHYVAMPVDKVTLPEMLAWANEVIQILYRALSARGFSLQYEMSLLEK